MIPAWPVRYETGRELPDGSHDAGEGNPHTERADNPLNHHELCHADSIIEADVAEDAFEISYKSVKPQLVINPAFLLCFMNNIPGHTLTKQERRHRVMFFHIFFY